MSQDRSENHILHVLKNASSLLLGNVAGLLFSLAHNVMAARMLGTHQFGLLALILAYAITINQIFESRVWEAAIKYVSQFLEEGKRLQATAMLKLCYVIDIIASVVTFIFIEMTAQLTTRFILKDPSVEYELRLYGVFVLLLIPRGTGYALLRLGDRYNWQAMQIAGMSALRALGVGFVWITGGGLLGVVWCHLFSWAIGMLWLAWMSRSVYRSLDLLAWKDAPLRLLKPYRGDLVKFLMSTNAISLFQAIQKNGESLILGLWLTPSDIGYLRTARSFSDLMGFPVQPLYMSSYPKFTQLFQQKRHEELKRLVYKVVGVTIPVALGGIILLEVFGGVLIKTFYGAKYLPAVPILFWLAIGSAFAMVLSFLHPLLTATNRVSLSLIATIIGIGLQVVALIYLVPRQGAVAAGMGMTAYWISWAIISMLGIRRYAWLSNKNK